MLHRFKTFLLCIGLLAFVLQAGCAGNPAGSQDNAGMDSEKQAAANFQLNGIGKNVIIGSNLKYDCGREVNGGKPIELKLWSWDSPVRDIYLKYINEYTRIHSNVKIKYSEQSFDDFQRLLPVAVMSGQGPDIFAMHNVNTYTFLPFIAEYPEDIFPKAQMEKDYDEANLNEINGKIYFLQTGTMTSLILYNRKMWQQAGLTDLDIPKTWDELRNTAKKLVKKDQKGDFQVYGFCFNGASYFINLLSAMDYQKGIFMFGRDGKTPTFDNPITINNAVYIKSMYDVDGLGDSKGLAAPEMMGQNKAAMIYCWSWVPEYLKENYPETDIGWFPLPDFDGKVPPAYDRNNVECSLSVNKYIDGDYQQAAFDFLKFLIANDDFQAEFAIKNGMYPTKLSARNHPAIDGDPLMSMLAGRIDRTVWTGPIPSEYEKIEFNYIEDDILVNNIPVEKALGNAAEIAKNDLEKSSFISAERNYKYASGFSN